MATPTLIEQVTSGRNGTRIYLYAGRYYAVDGEIDCRSKDAASELQRDAWTSDRDLEIVRRKVQHATGR